MVAGASPLVKAFLAGSMSGTCSTLLFQVWSIIHPLQFLSISQPLDVVKTRLQTAAHSKSMTGELRAIMTDQGLTGLWRGLRPSLYRYCTAP